MLKPLAFSTAFVAQHYGNLGDTYLDYFNKCGFAPILLTKNNYKEVLADCSGLVFSGGSDLTPTLFGDKFKGSVRCNKDLDLFEISVLEHALSKNKKIFGICRGMQLIARWFLANYTELRDYFYFAQDIKGHIGVNHGVISYSSGKEYQVNSFHHQGLIRFDEVKKPVFVEGKMFNPVFYSPFYQDQHLIEGLYVGENVHGVQWHPEVLNDVKYFEAFMRK